MWPENKYRGVRELLIIPKKGGLENPINTGRRPMLTAAEGSRGGGGREWVSPSVVPI